MSMPRLEGKIQFIFKMWYLLCQSFLQVHNLTATYQKTFILGPLVPCMVGFYSMTTDLRGWDQISISSTLLNVFKCQFFWSQYLGNWFVESINTWTKVVKLGWLYFWFMASNSRVLVKRKGSESNSCLPIIFNVSIP